MKKVLSLITLFILSAMIAVPAHSQKKGKKKKKKNRSAISNRGKGGDNAFLEKTKNANKIEGLFDFYQDKTTGKVLMAINKEDVGKEYIYFSYVENGVTDAHFFKGDYRGSHIFKINKYFNKIEFINENTNYYYDANSPLSKSAGANVNNSILVSEAILAFNSDSTTFLIDADNIFLTEKMQQVKYSPNPKYMGFKMGRLVKEKNKYSVIHNYPSNTDIVVDYVYEDPYPQRYGSEAISDSRSINIKIQHSLIEVPKSDYQPRFDDPRVGYFLTKVNDMTTTEAVNYRDLINRWNLKKKSPESRLSEPIEPIVFWIENTTPLEFRDIIKEGVEFWNQAFRSAGFINAVQVKMQPDTADWDAGDLRYNVIRWISSPSPVFGGYGPSFVNPRTGEILGADIMLEWVYMTNRIKLQELFVEGYQQGETEIDLESDINSCNNGEMLQTNNLMGIYAAEAMGLSDDIKEELVRQSLYRLVLHEVGHTLGLAHNFKGSLMLTYDEVNDKNTTYKKGLCTSVMEYPAINFSLNPEDQGLFYDTIPGPYDHWAIRYGYSEEDDQGLQKILAESTKPEHRFANDADDMRWPGKGMDPDAMIYDLSSDPVRYAIDRVELVKRVMPNLPAKYLKEGKSHQELKNAQRILIRQYMIATGIMARQFGGVIVDRSFVGQETDALPYTPVSYEKQKEAMRAVSKYTFSPKAFEFGKEVYPLLQRQRRGWDTPMRGEDPKIHEHYLFIQQMTLRQMLNTWVLNRIVNSSLYGNKYSIGEYMGDVQNSMFKDDLNSSVNSFRQSLQVFYIQRLISLHDSKELNLSIHAEIHKQLKTTEAQLKKVKSIGDASTRSHREYLLFLLKKHFEA